MQWVKIEAEEARQDPIPGLAAAAQPQARKPGSTSAADAESPKQLSSWKPTHTPRIRSDELVIVLKPRITMNLHAAFGPGGIGTAVQRLTGSTANAGISVWPVWDQNIVVVGVKTEILASKLIGDVMQTIGDRPMVTFKGRRVPRYIHYCSENVSVRYYKKTVPACYRCGTVGHRLDACPNPDNRRCIHCSAKVDIAPDGPAEHECQPECLVCGENHFTSSAQCVGKFRKAWKPAAPQPQHGQKSKQGGPPSPPKTGAKQQSKRNKPKPSNVPAGQKSKPPTFQAGDFPQLASPPKLVSNWAGVSSQSPTTTAASPSHPEIIKQLEAMKKRIEILEHENQMLKATQAAPPPPQTEMEAMHASACSDDEQETGALCSWRLAPWLRAPRRLLARSPRRDVTAPCSWRASPPR
ncbi:hypothetical protein HPB52_004902 [Rhipicephalus sanguineus]|uniref:CCHC-type domain-containing protein n=1 Tax=Rhipicephalus sanguineus TaxID=34632 RepID=A0A9D4STB2_RHISA|nr:hypothetical protein HPB52_004902 [Rhipicephalus sanguineus]